MIRFNGWDGHHIGPMSNPIENQAQFRSTKPGCFHDPEIVRGREIAGGLRVIDIRWHPRFCVAKFDKMEARTARCWAEGPRQSASDFH